MGEGEVQTPSKSRAYRSTNGRCVLKRWNEIGKIVVSPIEVANAESLIHLPNSDDDSCNFAADPRHA
jgi:hypothetical protein